MGLTVLLISFGITFVAEMGDKTQLLAIAFAAKYKMWQVLTGMFLSTVLLNLMAVALGGIVSQYETINKWIMGAAAVSFLIFGVWNLKEEKEENSEYKSKTGLIRPILAVVLAFFLAELGDKTQLSTISLSVSYPDYPLLVLAGTVFGLFGADVLGVLAGTVIAKKVPEALIKKTASSVFILFGFVMSWSFLRNKCFLDPVISGGIVFLLGIVTFLIGFIVMKAEKKS